MGRKKKEEVIEEIENVEEKTSKKEEKVSNKKAETKKEKKPEIKEETTKRILNVRIRENEHLEREKVAKVTGESGADDGSLKKEPVKKEKKPGRNDPCPCGSGKKYKKCCGRYE